MNKRALKFVLSTLLSLTLILAFAQEDKFRLNATSLGFGYLCSSIQSQKFGVNFNFDVSARQKKKLFSIYLNRGYLIQINEREEKTTEVSLTYGRAIDFNSWLSGEAHLGVGYFNHKRGYYFSESAVGVPLRLKLLVRTGEHFSIGINPNVNLNTVGIGFTGNIVFQYGFRKD